MPAVQGAPASHERLPGGPKGTQKLVANFLAAAAYVHSLVQGWNLVMGSCRCLCRAVGVPCIPPSVQDIASRLKLMQLYQLPDCKGKGTRGSSAHAHVLQMLVQCSYTASAQSQWQAQSSHRAAVLNAAALLLHLSCKGSVALHVPDLSCSCMHWHSSNCATSCCPNNSATGAAARLTGLQQLVSWTH
jgi:hypothetical protein